MAKSVMFAVLLAACGGGPAPAKPGAPAQAQVDDPTCPVTVAGTSVSSEDTANGAALVFVTTSDVAELRKRVGALARSHNDHHAAMGALPTGNEQGGGHDHHDHAAMQATAPAQTGAMIGVHSKASAEDIEGGAKLVFIAFPDGVGKIQGELRMHAQHLASGSCKMDH